MSWATVVAKFEHLAAPYADRRLRQTLVEAVGQLDAITVRELTALLATVRREVTMTSRINHATAALQTQAAPLITEGKDGAT
jgi:hypothetical protein